MTYLKKNNKVVLGLSGGVDSTAAALLLLETGYDVTGLYFSVSGDEEGKKQAEYTARQLGIGFIAKDISKKFNDLIIADFCREYMSGRTPNPCVICNPLLKFKTLAKAADETGAYHIATGHYADIYHDEASDVWYIKKASNEKKDQSYMLYRLEQDIISRLLLPLSNIESKAEIRELARDNGLENADAKDSQEICFIEKGDDYKSFLKRRGITAPCGNFVDRNGNVLGKHGGITDYTIGQRKGLGIALGKPAFVTEIRSDTNTVVLGDDSDLYSSSVISTRNIIMGKFLDNLKSDRPDAAASIGFIGLNEGLEAKIRYAARPAAASLEILDDFSIKTTFEKPQRAVTPGQSIVFYKDDLVIGGGIIDGKENLKCVSPAARPD